MKKPRNPKDRRRFAELNGNERWRGVWRRNERSRWETGVVDVHDLAGGDFPLGRRRELVGALDFRNAPAHQLRGSQRGEDDELEGSDGGGTPRQRDPPDSPHARVAEVARGAQSHR